MGMAQALRKKERYIMHFTYCPQCGKRLIPREIGDEGMLPYCEDCRRPFWDMFATSVICAAINEYNEVALLRQDYVSTQNYVCVAGIIQMGETAESAAVREIKEEIGQDVQHLTYVRSYYYEKSGMLMLGFMAEVKKTDFVLSGEVDAQLGCLADLQVDVAPEVETVVEEVAVVL